MGLSFVRRMRSMKKNRGLLLGGDDDPFDVATPLGGGDDPFDVATHATSKNDGGSAAPFAVLRSATASYDGQSSRQSSRQSSDPSHRQSRQLSHSSGATKASAGTPKRDGSDAALNATHATLNTTADLSDRGTPATPSPARRGRYDEEDTPLVSNQASFLLERDADESFARGRDEFERCYDEAEGREGGAEGSPSFQLWPSQQPQQQAGGQAGGPAPPAEEIKGKKKKKKKKEKTKRKKKKKKKDKTANGSKGAGKGKIKGRVGASLRRGFLPPSRRDTAPIAAPPTPRRDEGGDGASEERRPLGEVLPRPERDAGTGREPGVELELTPGVGDDGRDAGNGVANDEGANGSNINDKDTLGNGIDLAYDNVIRRHDMPSVGVGYDQIDVSDGSVERKEEPSLQSYLASLGEAIEELLVGSKDQSKDEGTPTKLPEEHEGPALLPMKEGEGPEVKLMKEDEGTAAKPPKDDDVGSTGASVEKVVKKVEKRPSATVRGSLGRKNLTSLFTSASDDPEDAPKDRHAGSPAEPKFLSRLRKIGGARGNAIANAHERIGADLDGGELRHADSRSHRENDAVAAHPNPVPEFVLRSDDASMPSLLTEPEIRHGDGASWRRTTPRGKGRARAVTPTSIDDGSGACATAARGCRPLSPSIAGASIVDGRSDNDGGDGGSGTYLGLTAASTSGYTAGAYSRAGGIEKVWKALTCGEDTTVAGTAGCGITDAACGVGSVGAACSRADAGEVEQTLERHVELALEFQSDIIKNGIKLIYHESPAHSSVNNNWIQSTVKLFLRPGNCHNGSRRRCQNKQPTLFWAVLPVVSRMQKAGSFDSSEADMWTNLGLLDIHSLMIDEDSTDMDGVDGRDTAPSITGFFSITANDGAVYVFEAPSVGQRDYVVTGLRAIIARLTYHMVAGNADVIGEMFTEDAGVLTGELPSLVTPWKALHRATHMFLDKL